MNNSRPTTYTPLETLFLFQLLSRYGFINGSFDRISQELKSTPLVLEQSEYDAGRLAPDSLQQLALQLLGEEQRREAETVLEKGVNGLSPTSKKRKLQSPPLPTLKEAHENPDKLPILVDRLYARFRDELVRQIREDERLYQQREREIDEIERGEWDEKINQERGLDAVNRAAPSEKDVPLLKPNGHATLTLTLTPTPMPTPVAPVVVQAPVQDQPQIQEPAKRAEPIPTPAPTSVPPPAPPAPPAAPLAAPPVAPPPHLAAQEKKTLQKIPSPLVPTTAMRSATEQRHIVPDGRSQPDPVRTSNGTAPVLQHPQMAPGYGPRPPSNTPQPQLQPPEGLQRPDSLPKTKSPVPGQQGQAQAPALKWEPPYQPHQPPHQTPVPSPRPPYTSGIARPPVYPSHAQPVSSQAPQHVQQSYAGARPTTGQTVSQPRFSTQGTSAPSPPVLLAPQNAGQIPPSLQSLPPNATPDGTGQHGSHQRPPSVTPVTASPTPAVGRSPHVQHQAQSLPTQTPIRPPPGLGATHPAIVATKPSKPSIQPPQLSNSARVAQPRAHPPSQPRPPPHLQQQPVPSTPSNPPQPQGFPRSQVIPYNPQPKPAGGPDVPQRLHLPPVQTPISTPQASHPSSVTQPQTPIGVKDSSQTLKAYATKWTATPTPTTPRIKNMREYFGVESPAYEPLSPPMLPAELPKTSLNPDQKDTSKAVVKSETSKSRSRPPRASQGAETIPQPREVIAETGPPVPAIKNEEATPQTLQEAVDTAAGQRLQSRTSAANNSSNKRKRQDSPANRGPPTPATHVLWTRAFHKISMTALDQIIGHRYANMFAHPIKPRLAPGYYEIILRPQDLKGIQKAITAGSKAAAAAVATMPDIDANAPAVWLPISIDLVPPRGIINIAQLERELIHMFANAIMYNPDPLRGLGPSFLKSYQSNSEEGEDGRGYEFDENGVVKETRNMYAEVEKLLGDLRNEVVTRTPAVVTGSRSVSAAVGESNTVEDDGDEIAGDAKRRRIRG